MWMQHPEERGMKFLAQFCAHNFFTDEANTEICTEFVEGQLHFSHQDVKELHEVLGEWLADAEKTQAREGRA